METTNLKALTVKELSGLADKLKIQDYIGKYFEINKSGFSIIYINTIPRNHSGKILYSELVKN